MIVPTSRLVLFASLATLSAFLGFLGTPVETPVGVLIALAVLPTSEMALAAAAIMDSARQRFEDGQPLEDDRRR